MTPRPAPPSSTEQAARARARRVAELTAERWPALSTLGLERIRHFPIPARPVVVDDRPHLQAARRAALVRAVRASEASRRTRDDLLDSDDMNGAVPDA